MQSILLYVGAVLIAGWGMAHLFPTRNVVKGFGPVSEDNRNIITMEWVIEGVSLMYIGITVLVLTLMGGLQHPLGIVYFRMASLVLLVLAGVSFFTGAKVSLLPFKLCVPIMLLTAVVFFLATVI